MEAHIHPAFIVYIGKHDLQKATMKLPSQFVKKYGEHIPHQVLFQLPNGYQYYSRFKNDLKLFENVGRFFADFQNDKCFYVLVYYKFDGIFSIFILDHSGMEIDYPSAKKLLLAPVTLEENLDGIGKKFILRTSEEHVQCPELELPDMFIDHFRHMIKRNNYLTLKNGNKFKFKYSAAGRKFVNVGLLQRSKYWKVGDTLLFELTAKTEFVVSIFNSKRVERQFSESSSLSVSSAEHVGYSRFFDAVIIPANLDSNCHGVYIPSWIVPQNSDWKNMKYVILRMNDRRWKVGVVCSKLKAILSSGWDYFAKENSLSLNDTLRFAMLEDGNRIGFVVYVI